VLKQDIFDTRVRVKRLLPIVTHESNFNDFMNEASSCGLPNGLDGKLIVENDEAIAVINEVWKYLLNKHTIEDDAVCTFVEYLEMLVMRKGFLYNIFRDDCEQVTGVV